MIRPSSFSSLSLSSSWIARWASGVLRERVALAATATLPTHWFSGLFFRELLGRRSDAPPTPLPLGGLRVLPEAQSQSQSQWSEHLWFAVPKSKISRSRKRMKTTRQKRIPLKKNIVFDPRTGEVTLKHKLPYNWKDYLPKEE